MKSRGKKYWCGAGNTATLPPAGLQRQRAIARLNRDAFGLQAVQRDVPQRALGVVEGGFGAHVVARLAIGRRGHLEAGVVVVGDVGVVGGEDRFLLNQAAARIERVGKATVEAAHAETVEHDLHPFADAARGRAAQLQRALHVARAVGVGRRIVEEGVPSASPLAGLALIERTRAADDGVGACADGRDERLRGIQRERRAPRASRLVGPGDGHRFFSARDADRARPHAAEVERHGRRGCRPRDEDQNQNGEARRCA